MKVKVKFSLETSESEADERYLFGESWEIIKSLEISVKSVRNWVPWERICRVKTFEK